MAFNAFRSGRGLPTLLIAVTGLTSLGVMIAVNFAIASEFRYLLAGLGGLWAISTLMDLFVVEEPINVDG